MAKKSKVKLNNPSTREAEMTRLRMKRHRSKQSYKEKRKEIIMEQTLQRVDRMIGIWKLKPNAGYQVNHSKDSNINYGRCDKVHNWQKLEDLKFTPGFFTIGNCYDIGHREKLYGRTMSITSERNIEFLKAVERYLQKYYPVSKGLEPYMRVSFIQGASTTEHTDTMRGPTPTFVFIQPHSNFHLKVRNCPLFKASVVMLFGELYIPHQYRETDGLTMIGLHKGSLFSPFTRFIAIQFLFFSRQIDYFFGLTRRASGCVRG